jgi:hypothetical protein
MTNPPHIIQSANGRTYDLTALETPFGLLPEDVREALEAWPHGWHRFHCVNGEYKWQSSDNEILGMYPATSYRAKPAPKITEHVMWWASGNYAVLTKAPWHTHRLTIRHIGDTLPYGTYTGPDGATITVEKAE